MQSFLLRNAVTGPSKLITSYEVRVSDQELTADSGSLDPAANSSRNWAQSAEDAMRKHDGQKITANKSYQRLALLYLK